MPDTTFASLFRSARTEAGLTQKEASELLNISKRAIESWEGGQRQPKPYAQPAILRALRSAGKEKKMEMEIERNGDELTVRAGDEVIAILDIRGDTLCQYWDDIQINDETGEPILSGDDYKRTVEIATKRATQGYCEEIERDGIEVTEEMYDEIRDAVHEIIAELIPEAVDRKAFRIRETSADGARLTYDDLYCTREEAGKAIRRYKEDDEGREVIYDIVEASESEGQ